MKLAKFQLWMQVTVFAVFLLLTPPTLTVWKDSIPWLQFLSIFAIVEGAAGGIAAALAAVESTKTVEAAEAAET